MNRFQGTQGTERAQRTEGNYELPGNRGELKGLRKNMGTEMSQEHKQAERSQGNIRNGEVLKNVFSTLQK